MRSSDLPQLRRESEFIKAEKYDGHNLFDGSSSATRSAVPCGACDQTQSGARTQTKLRTTLH